MSSVRIVEQICSRLRRDVASLSPDSSEEQPLDLTTYNGQGHDRIKQDSAVAASTTGRQSSSPTSRNKRKQAAPAPIAQIPVDDGDGVVDKRIKAHVDQRLSEPVDIAESKPRTFNEHGVESALRTAHAEQMTRMIHTAMSGQPLPSTPLSVAPLPLQIPRTVPDRPICPSFPPDLAAVIEPSPGTDSSSEVSSLPLPLLATFEQYIVKSSGSLCLIPACTQSANREHFHCRACGFKLFTKKDEMLRHYKWHRKREESLAQGFMRYSATDDCSRQFRHCSHNLRQTHYHCLQPGCDKVYISTSDVQMHANSHRKADHIAREGFQRYKASEPCGRLSCPFSTPSHKTTHFHCLRSYCEHSFKNKSDIEKHKAHHAREEQLQQDGFKRVPKGEPCRIGRMSCPLSRVVNHIHCIRDGNSIGCSTVLHSTSQMYSHKRRHDRADRIRDGGTTDSRSSPPSGDETALTPLPASKWNVSKSLPSKSDRVEPVIIRASSCFESEQDDEPKISLTTLQSPVNLLKAVVSGDVKKTPSLQSISIRPNDGLFATVVRYTANDPCTPHCPMMYQDHYHCAADSACKAIFKSKDGVREHSKQHDLLKQCSSSYKQVGEGETCTVQGCEVKEKHYHCGWKDCKHVVVASDPLFARLDHFHLHEIACTSVGLCPPRRVYKRRGRPPKNAHAFAPLYPRLPSSLTMMPRKSISIPNANLVEQEKHVHAQVDLIPGGTMYSVQSVCPLAIGCPCHGARHFHCNEQRCLFVTETADGLRAHQSDFHDVVEIPQGFICYDRRVVCGQQGCGFSGRQRHFHCRTCLTPFAKINQTIGHVHTEEELKFKR